LLNPDTTLCDGAITAMCDCASAHRDIGVLGARMIVYEDNTKKYRKAYRFDAQGLCYTDWIVGALMLFDMTMLRQVGMFDEHIFLFFEETDLCDRMLKAGYKLAICQHAEAEHYPGTSSTTSVQLTKIKAWHTGWSRAYYFNKQFGCATALRKSIGKVLNNLIRIMNRSTLAMCRKRRKSIRSPIYETIGTLSYFIGLKAFRKDGTARIT
jgi:GT2 family glycosyltransferase